MDSWIEQLELTLLIKVLLAAGRCFIAQTEIISRPIISHSQQPRNTSSEGYSKHIQDGDILTSPFTETED